MELRSDDDCLVSIATSWMRLRKYPVKAEILSDHALRLHFDYGNLKTLPLQLVTENNLS